MMDSTESLRSYFRNAQNKKVVEKARRDRGAALCEKAICTMAEPGLLSPDWTKYANPYFPRSLMLLFTLSVGINPDLAYFEQDGVFDAFLDGAIATENKDVIERLNAFTSRWEQFEVSGGHPDTPKAWPEIDYPHRPLLRPIDFVAWAVSVGWELPRGFPGVLIAEPKKQVVAQNGVDWKDDARRLAFEFIQKWNGKGKPSMAKTVAPAVAKKLEEQKILGRGRRPIGADTILRQALGGYDKFMAAMTENK